MQRRAKLPENGCKYCFCKGCNPMDIRRDKRQEIKNNLKLEGKQTRNQCLFDSDDEELALENQFDYWNRSRQLFGRNLQDATQISMFIMGIGVPFRHPSYILGRPISD
jgi:hypothetical protein